MSGDCCGSVCVPPVPAALACGPTAGLKEEAFHSPTELSPDEDVPRSSRSVVRTLKTVLVSPQTQRIY